MINLSRAISTTRTIFRLNTNQSHAYEDCNTQITIRIDKIRNRWQPNLLHILLSAPDEWLVPS